MVLYIDIVDGWQDGSIYDTPTPGIAITIDQLRLAGYRVVVYSTRCATNEGIFQISTWLKKYNIKVDNVCSTKPAAYIYVDDRAINFNGNCEKLIKDINKFESWTEKKHKICPCCGKEFFMSNISSNRKKYCSDRCRIKMNNKFIKKRKEKDDA